MEDAMSDTGKQEKVPASELDVLTAELDKKNGGTFDGGAAAVVVALDVLTTEWATKVRAYLDTDRDLVAAVALAIVTTLRFAFTFNGRPDVNGTSGGYQAANRALVARLAGPTATDAERVTLRNRLQKRIIRTNNAEGHLLTQGVVDAVVTRDKVKLNRAQREALRTHRYASLKDETDAKVQDVVAAVNAAFGAGASNRKKTDARSQFERGFVATNASKPRNVVVEGDDEGNADALDNAATVKNLPVAAASGNVKRPDLVRSIFHALSVLGRVNVTDPPVPADADEMIALLEHVSFLAYGMTADLDGSDLDGDNLDGYAAATDAAVEMFGGNDNDNDNDNDEILAALAADLNK